VVAALVAEKFGGQGEHDLAPVSGDCGGGIDVVKDRFDV
jgi:hypothetical protein